MPEPAAGSARPPGRTGKPAGRAGPEPQRASEPQPEPPRRPEPQRRPEPRGGQAPVLVVGAGPVGMAAALALRAHGLSVAVIEADAAGRVRPGSRALFVHRESLRLLDHACPGLAARIIAYGTTWRTKRTFYRGRQVYERTFPPPGGLPPFTSLRQVDTERFLMEACESAGVSFHWDAEVAGVRVTDQAAELTTSDGRTWSASHVIAADGARSAVRRSLGIAMEGTRSEGFHVVVDVADPPGARSPSERVFHYEHPGAGGRSLMKVPFAGGFQVDLQCRAGDDPDEYGTPETVGRWLPGVAGDGLADRVLWVSTYRFLRVVAAGFADPRGRVLLAGEAAHLFPPFGARGMNSGIADACAAAGAVAAALAGASGSPVEEYAAARRAAALFNSAAAGAALDHLRPRRRIVRLKQRMAAALAPVVPRCGAWLDDAPYGPRRGPVASAGGRY